MEPDRIRALFKFGKREDINQFLCGRMLMNTLAYFRSIEDTPVRRDIQEGDALWLPADGAILSIKCGADYQPVGNLTGSIRYSHPNDLRANVFCMYAMRFSNLESKVHPGNFAFGDTFAVLIDGNEFLNRVEKAAQKIGQDVSWRLVEYIDKQTHRGPVGIFRKAADYSYQSEFRIALLPGTGSPLTLDIGDITKIAISGDLAHVNQRIRVTEAANPEASV